MNNFEYRKLQESIEHLKIEVQYQKEWNNIPESLKPTSKGRWDQIMKEEQLQVSRKLGFPNSRGF